MTDNNKAQMCVKKPTKDIIAVLKGSACRYTRKHAIKCAMQGRVVMQTVDSLQMLFESAGAIQCLPRSLGQLGRNVDRGEVEIANKAQPSNSSIVARTKAQEQEHFTTHFKGNCNSRLSGSEASNSVKELDDLLGKLFICMEFFASAFHDQIIYRERR
jgi:hypothetical protein